MASERRRSRPLPDEHAPSESPVPVRPPSPPDVRKPYRWYRGRKLTAAEVRAVERGGNSLSRWPRTVPLICGAREMAEAGCLFSYLASIKDMWYRSASFVDKILKGAKPADLPVQQGTKFEFVVNLKTARALGFDVPPILLARADEVIE